ncbi:hypothetical protein COLO4_06614 [Corchorus olitorius]|uniref:Uncharacterized protein n=1 Tax=Corchorus olitorius TaxID=93759 RepID=A0A1R3KMH2_9ROSI|nr:hypothetical protein COLO4_06614 [Corchorus olitorius]
MSKSELEEDSGKKRKKENFHRESNFNDDRKECFQWTNTCVAATLPRLTNLLSNTANGLSPGP